MNSMKEFAEEVEMRDFLGQIVSRYNRNWPDKAIDEQVFEIGVGTFKHIMEVYTKLTHDDNEHAAGNYIASCLGTYIMLFNQLSVDEIILTPTED